VLLKRGAYDFPCLAHTEADVDRTIAVVERALRETA
jgi:glutamate-1-semialdehyde aminotransferase